jgi:catechol 2,3-dioxygenase-like lactoylglutathione lyase family enzyme
MEILVLAVAVGYRRRVVLVGSETWLEEYTMAERRKGIPGLAGGEHIGITVPDLNQAVDFLVDVIGCDFIFDGGEVKGRPDFMRNSLGVDPDATMRYCYLRCGNGLNLEVFEYKAPAQRKSGPRNSDIGGHHIAFYVDDIDAAVAHLKKHGVTVQGVPDHIKEGAAAGTAWVYFLAPWGLQLELISYPDGKAYEKGAKRVLWHPKRPDR